jgi:hypothetical protein
MKSLRIVSLSLVMLLAAGQVLQAAQASIPQQVGSIAKLGVGVTAAAIGAKALFTHSSSHLPCAMHGVDTALKIAVTGFGALATYDAAKQIPFAEYTQGIEQTFDKYKQRIQQTYEQAKPHQKDIANSVVRGACGTTVAVLAGLLATENIGRFLGDYRYHREDYGVLKSLYRALKWNIPKYSDEYGRAVFATGLGIVGAKMAWDAGKKLYQIGKQIRNGEDQEVR